MYFVSAQRALGEVADEVARGAVPGDPSDQLDEFPDSTHLVETLRETERVRPSASRRSASAARARSQRARSKAGAPARGRERPRLGSAAARGVQRRCGRFGALPARASRSLGRVEKRRAPGWNATSVSATSTARNRDARREPLSQRGRRRLAAEIEDVVHRGSEVRRTERASCPELDAHTAPRLGCARSTRGVPTIGRSSHAAPPADRANSGLQRRSRGLESWSRCATRHTRGERARARPRRRGLVAASPAALT